MTLVAHDAIRHIQHTLSSDEVPAIGALRILNDAGEYLVNMHNWRWLEGAQVKLDLHKDVDHVWLPDNFREIIGYDATQGLTSGLELTSHQYLVELRSNEVSTSAFRYWAAVTWADRKTPATNGLIFGGTGPVATSTVKIDDQYNTAVFYTFSTAAGDSAETDTSREVVIGSSPSAKVSAAAFTDAVNATPTLFMSSQDTASGTATLTHRIDGTTGNATLIVLAGTTNITYSNGSSSFAGGRTGGPPKARLDIYPTPTADTVNGLTLYFRGGWEQAEGDNDLISIPSYIECLYLQIVRAFARGYERESEADVSQRLAVIAGGPLVAAARQRDKESQPNLGPMRGGAAQSMYAGAPGNFWNFSSVSGPS